MRNHGKYIVLGIFLLAVLLAVGNMWYQTRSSRRAIDYWGSKAAGLIVTAPRVEVLKLRPGGKPGEGESLSVGGQRIAVARIVDASKAPGLLHVRRALVADALFLWDEARREQSPQWHYAVRFRDGEASVTVLLDEPCLWLATLEHHDQPMRVRRNEKKGDKKHHESPLREFVEEQFGKPKPPPQKREARVCTTR